MHPACRSPRYLSGVLSAAELGRLDIRVCERDGVVMREGEAELAGDVGSVANELVKRNGAGTVTALAGHFPDGATSGAARQVLAAQGDVIWLDDRREWFLVRGVPHRSGTRFARCSRCRRRSAWRTSTRASAGRFGRSGFRRMSCSAV
jgi:hypothetical protein